MPSRKRSRSQSRGRARSASAVSKVKERSSVRKRKNRSTNPNVYDNEINIRVSKRIQYQVARELKLVQSKEVNGVSPDTGNTQTRERINSSPGGMGGSKKTSAQGHGDVIGFGGSLGGAFLMVFLPLVTYAILITSDKANGCSLSTFPSIPSNWDSYFDVNAFGVVLSWYAFQALLALVPLGKVAKGQPLKDGKKLDYRCNGLLALMVSIALFLLAIYQGYDMMFIYTHRLQLLTSSVVLSFLLSIALYVKALFVSSNELAPESTGAFLNDFFMGRELNPRIGALDLKFFFELRPGLIGWMLIDWCLCATQLRGDGTVHPALALVTLFQTFYVVDALKNEASILTTMDITTEGFGFMLAFGDVVWVPFLYSLQAHYIYTYPDNAVSNTYALLAICALEVLGLVIFRGANSQKDKFRNNPNDPSVAHLKTIPTSTGKKLLCSGYWGLCRRPNYLGDLLMAAAWSLTCGTTHLLPYFYPVYFLILLIHRQVRDEAYCRQRYGSAWDKYCTAVPYRIFPYVF